MRGVVTFLVALFMLGPYYLLMTMVFEPLINIVTSIDLSVINGAATIGTYQDILFLWGPFIYVAGWFIWAIRYYVSPNLTTGQVRR